MAIKLLITFILVIVFFIVPGCLVWIGVSWVPKVWSQGVDVRATWSKFKESLSGQANWITLKDQNAVYQQGKIVGYIKSEPISEEKGLCFLIFIEEKSPIELIEIGGEFEFRNDVYKVVDLRGFTSGAIDNVKINYARKLIAQKV